MLLIIQSIINGDLIEAKLKLSIILAMWALVAISMSIDLICGWNKAKQRGEARTSYGLRRTVNKGIKYYAFMLFALIFDCIGLFFYNLPLATMIVAAFITIIEGKSVFEKANDKDKRMVTEELSNLITLLENKDDLISGLAKIIRKELNKNKDNDNDSFKDLDK